MLRTLFLLLHILIAIALIVLVLLQQGRGSEAGAAFGSGASSTVFGARGSASFLSRITAGLAAGFFLTSMILAYFAAQSPVATSVVGNSVINTTAPAQPANPTNPPPKPEAPANTSGSAPAEVPQIPQTPKQ